MGNLTQGLKLKPVSMLYRPLLILALLALFAGCATAPKPTEAPEALPAERPSQLPGISPAAPEAGPLAEEGAVPEPDTTELELMASQGLFLDAALGYAKLAENPALARRDHYTLRAAELLLTGSYVIQAIQYFNSIDYDRLGPDLKLRHNLMSIRLDLMQGLSEKALKNLDSLQSPLIAQSPQLQKQLQRLRIQAYEQLGRYLDSARERILLGAALEDPEEIQANQKAILLNLQKLTADTLQSILLRESSSDLRGWIELTLLSLSPVGSPISQEDIIAWQDRYPNHPAQASILDAILAMRPLTLKLPEKIALILPLHDRFAKAADAVRNGFLAAYYAQTAATARTGSAEVDAPVIQIYDEGINPEFIDFIYEQAISDGAEFVVGPLSKEAVSRLAEREELPVPVLALNFSNEQQDPASLSPNLFQISLSPELEAIQVAERAWLDGHNRSAVITPATEWGDRVASAFIRRWKKFGGDVVEVQHYDIRQNDYSLPIRRLLNVDESEGRQADLRRLLGEKLEFIPRRRQDVDFIFMASSSRQARLIRPQLRFHHAAKLPVYTTSRSYSGTVNVDMDRDMDDVMFSDIPWILKPEIINSKFKTSIEKSFPDSAKRFPRLYALGVDAYNIISKLDALRLNRADFYPGVTGDLYLDLNNRLQPRLMWAKFTRGKPEILDTF